MKALFLGVSFIFSLMFFGCQNSLSDATNVEKKQSKAVPSQVAVTTTKNTNKQGTAGLGNNKSTVTKANEARSKSPK